MFQTLIKWGVGILVLCFILFAIFYFVGIPDVIGDTLNLAKDVTGTGVNATEGGLKFFKEYTPFGLAISALAGETKARESKTSDCPAGYTNNGLTCGRGSDDYSTPSKVADCPAGYTNFGATCEPKSWGRGVGVVGPVVNEYYCPSSHPKHHGIWGSGWCDNWPLVDWPHEVRTTDERIRPKKNVSYSKSSGAVSGIVNSPNIGWKKCGAFYYPKCPSGMKEVGCNICRTIGSTKSMSSMICPSGYFKTGARCYKECKAGYTSMGETCHRPVSTKGLNSMICPPSGYPEYKKHYGGRCYKPCPNGWEPSSSGIMCNLIKK